MASRSNGMRKKNIHNFEPHTMAYRECSVIIKKTDKQQKAMHKSDFIALLFFPYFFFFHFLLLSWTDEPFHWQDELLASSVCANVNKLR